MGGVVRSVVSPVKKIVGGGGSGQSRASSQAQKKTEPTSQKIASRGKSRSSKRGNRIGRSLVGGTLAGAGTQTASLGTVRNPRNNKTTLGA